MVRTKIRTLYELIVYAQNLRLKNGLDHNLKQNPLKRVQNMYGPISKPKLEVQSDFIRRRSMGIGFQDQFNWCWESEKAKLDFDILVYQRKK